MVSSSTGLVGPSKACWPGVWRSSIRARRLSQPSLLARFTLDNVSFFGELTRRRPRASRRDSSYTALRAVLQPHIRFCDELIADALSPLPRACGASAHQLAAAEAPSAASLADAFWIASPLSSCAGTTYERASGPRPRAHRAHLGRRAPPAVPHQPLHIIEQKISPLPPLACSRGEFTHMKKSKLAHLMPASSAHGIASAKARPCACARESRAAR